MATTNMQAGIGAPNTAVMGGGSAVDPNSIWSDLSGIAGLGANIYGMVNSAGIQSNANQVFQQSNPFGQYRPQYGAQLSTLMSDPSSVAQLPGYQFLMDQGTQAIARGSAGPGGSGLGSGAMGASLEQYGQGLADQFYQQQVSTLSNLAGANIQPANPYQALQGKAGAAGNLGNSVTGLLSSLGGGATGVAGLLSKLFGGGGGGGGTAGSGAPSTYNPNTSIFTGAPGQTSVDWSGQTTQNDPWSTGTPTWNLPGATPYDPNAGFTGAPGQTSVDWGQAGGGTTDTSTPSFDLGGMFSNPNSAGGQATPVGSPAGTNTLASQSGDTSSMASTWGTVGTDIGLAGAGFGIASGLASGKPTGEASAALSAANLAAKGGLFGGNSGAVQGGAVQGMNILGLYSGIKQGGVAGYAQAANSAYGLATGSAGIPGVGQVLSVYNFAKNWGSGDTGGDALRGVEAGASIGSMVLPGIGTLVGGAIGGAVGAISSVFGSGKVDPENSNFNGFTQAYNAASTPQAKAQVAASTADPYLPLAGLFDLRSSQIKGNIPIVDQYGRMGEQKFVSDMFTQINSAVKKGTITTSSSTDEIMADVVSPWVNSFGKGQMNDSNGSAINAMVAGIVDDYRTGQQGNLKAVGGDSPFANVPAFGS